MLAQLHRWPAPSSICSQIPNSVLSHNPWLPSVQACRVGMAVGLVEGEAVGDPVGTDDGDADWSKFEDDENDGDAKGEL